MKKLPLILLLSVVLFTVAQADDQHIIDSSLVDTDVQQNDAFKPAVDVVTTIGVMNGVDTDKFAPYSNTTRATLATVLWRIAGQPGSVW